jgi:GntR family phosphonate transport system transcriptional regulator
VLWKEIHNKLLNDIHAGHYADGEKMPTEAELARRFSVNRHTVRRALGLLRDDGFVFSKKGSGVFVTSKNATYRIGKRTRFSQNISADSVPSRQITSVETRHATNLEAGKLALKTSDIVHVAEGVGHLKNAPIMHSVSRFPSGRCDGILAYLQTNPSKTDAFAALGISDYLRKETEVTAVTANAMMANILRCELGAPLLCINSVNTLLDGVPIEYGTTHFIGDRMVLSVHAD